MGTVNITEGRSVGQMGTFAGQVMGLPPLVVPYNITSSAASAKGPGFQTTTQLIRVETDTAIAVRCGADTVAAPLTAVVTDTRMPANTVEYFAVAPGQNIAVINT